jgi:hypothetical protein
VSIDLLHGNEDLVSIELTERIEPETEPFYDHASSAGEPISRFGLLSGELSGGAGAMYLREIAQHELLAAQEEVSLAQRLEAGKAAMRELATADDNLDADHRAELERPGRGGREGTPTLDRVQPPPGGVSGSPLP